MNGRECVSLSVIYFVTSSKSVVALQYVNAVSAEVVSMISELSNTRGNAADKSFERAEKKTLEE